MKVKCQVIEDLLPLYIDGVCSEESRIMIEEHLKECELCSGKLRAQKSELIPNDTTIEENLKSKAPFKKIKRYQRITIVSLLVIMIAVLTFTNSNLIWHSNAKRSMEKFFGHAMTVRQDMEYVYKGNKYRIVLCSADDNKDTTYLQCYKEKFGGLLYEPTYGAGPGNSSSLFGVTMHFMNGSNDNFIIVFGYNKDLKANNFSVQKATDSQWITQDISKQEYFLYVYTDIVYPKVIFKDAQDNDITGMFIGQ